MKKITFFRGKMCLPAYFLVFFFGMTSCSEKFVVVSDTNAYHVSSGKVFTVKYDSTMETYEQFRLTKDEYRKLVQTRYGATQKDSIEL